MADSLFPRWQKRLLLAAALGLALTGMGQMPVFPRYYIADIPGLGWLGDFRMTAALHLALAAILLFLLTSFATVWIAAGARRPTLSGVGFGRVALYAAIAATGLLRVLQNGMLPLFSPMHVRYLDWTHLGLVASLLVFALVWGRHPALASALAREESGRRPEPRRGG